MTLPEIKDRIEKLIELEPDSAVWRADVASLLREELKDKRALLGIAEELAALERIKDDFNDSSSPASVFIVQVAAFIKRARFFLEGV